MLTLITFIIVLSLLVFVHELGHFITARKFGVKAEEFGFGFPPRAWGIYKNSKGKWVQVKGNKKVEDAPGTVLSINWIPLGGFVKIKGEEGEGTDEKDSFASRPIWQRATILSAGVSMNVLLAMVLIIIGLMIGLPQVVDEELHPKAQVRDERIQIIQVLEGSPAREAGIKMGDIILGIDGNEFAKYQGIQNYVDNHQGQELDYSIKRGQDELNFTVTPKLMKETGKGGIGIAIAETGLVKYPWYIAIIEGVKTTFLLVWAIIVAFYELFKGIFMGQGVSADIAGPVGIAAITGQVARLGFIYVLQFTAMLSLNLAILNFLPIPALDGGRVIFLIVEKIRRKSMKQKLEAGLNQAFFWLLMLLVLLVTFRDIGRFGETLKIFWEKAF